MQEDRIGRPVRIASICFSGRSLAEIMEVVDREGERGADIIVLPETWRGPEKAPETLDGETVSAIASLARKHRAYIVCPIYRSDESRGRINSSVLIGRDGNVACVYDKAYPYWSEFELVPPCVPGTEAPVYDADFGRIGMAVCFDANFPEVWKRLADRGAELVLWPSAYSAGSTLQAHALNHHFPIVTSTLEGDCSVFDITGKEVYYQKEPGINVSRITLDLDRCIFHENFNLEKRDALLEKHRGGIEQETHMAREQWFVLKAVRPGISAREAAREFGMEELRDYQDRSRRAIDGMRGRPFSPPEAAGGHFSS